MIQVSEEVKADLRVKEAAKQAGKKAEEAKAKDYKDEQLSKSCPNVLAMRAPKVATRKKGSLGDATTEFLLEEQKKECEEWLRSKAPETSSTSNP